MNEQQGGGSGMRFFGAALAVIGLLWMALTGLCTAVVWGQSFVGVALGTDLSELFAMIPFTLMIATICMLPGFLIWLLGRWLRDRGRGAP